MFRINRDDSNTTGTYRSLRLQNLRFNPYVGSFAHSGVNTTMNTTSSSPIPNANDRIKPMELNSKSNTTSKLSRVLGLKAIAWENNKSPHISQFQIARDSKSHHRHLSMKILSTLPLSKFSNISSPSDVSIEDNDSPTCAICLEAFQDGDELRNLSCSHCFHRKCVDIWLLGTFSDESMVTANCPTCRRTAVQNTEENNEEDDDDNDDDAYHIGSNTSNTDEIFEDTEEIDSELCSTDNNLSMIGIEEYLALNVENLNISLSPPLSSISSTDDNENSSEVRASYDNTIATRVYDDHFADRASLGRPVVSIIGDDDSYHNNMIFHNDQALNSSHDDNEVFDDSCDMLSAASGSSYSDCGVPIHLHTK
jgi:hypothetical protein